MPSARVVLLMAAAVLLPSTDIPAAVQASGFDAVASLFRTHCVKCHGPLKREAKLNLATATGLARGGETGAVVVPHDVQASLLWQRVRDGEMPPDKPLAAEEQTLLKNWIAAGAPGQATRVTTDGEHWAFRRLTAGRVPAVKDAARVAGEIDRFIQARLEAEDLSLGPEADRASLLRRASFILTGLPPEADEFRAHLADNHVDAFARLIDRKLASPHFGERWGKLWLDAAGYADSNGYFNADTDRPLAWRYRDYVVRSFNDGKPFHQFVREQLAGDELAGFAAGDTATPETLELLIATHYLRNGQDGSGESDGNPDEIRVDRYAALESAMQVVTSSLLGLTIQCAKCHDHKFEPITQRDFYEWQAFFYPVFNIQDWVKPNDRIVYAPLPGELEAWERQRRQIEIRIAALQSDLTAWVQAHRPRGNVLFADTFETAKSAANWSATAPGDDAPAGAMPVGVGSAQPPAARVREGRLQIIESGAAGNRWLSSQRVFDWTPNGVGASIQFTFDLVDHRLDPSGRPAARIGYYIALHDYSDNSDTAGGNILIDGNPGGSTAVHLDYPGHDSTAAGSIGSTGYTPGRNYGVRITNIGDDKFRLEQLVDWAPEEKSLMLTTADLPAGGIGFEYCCGRSFVVDNILVEATPPAGDRDEETRRFNAELTGRRQKLLKMIQQRAALPAEQPGKIAWATDVSNTPPQVFLLERGNYAAPREPVEAVPLSALLDPQQPFEIPTPAGGTTTGRRLALANWLTGPDSRQSALLARVQVNRIWQHVFGTGLVPTPENLGMSGAAPSHPALLDWLAAEFVRSNWDVKHVLRLILQSATFRQSSALREQAYAVDPDDRLGWRYPPHRLDAEALRDAMLAVSGDLDRTRGGPYVSTSRAGAGEVVIHESTPGARKRSLYLQQRRTQVVSLLTIFDAPSIVFNSMNRPRSTTPLQSLTQLNSEFALAQARSFARRLEQEPEGERIPLAFVLAYCREPSPAEQALAVAFLQQQIAGYGTAVDATRRAWMDFCQALLAANEFIYVD